jgi:lipopolysaccharide/colanic/teichoic acid biosynthesis glycosyltransferase
VALQRTIKQIADFGLALALLVILSPVFVIIAIAIRLRMGIPVFFTQPRPGQASRVFKFYKFRTMTNEHDADGQPKPDEQRLTKLGKFLRRTSLDELPQLWNVLRGDMSFVGPRPLLVRYLDRYTPEQARRHRVKPGITGWAQINGRNLLHWDEKFKLDVWYVDHWNLGLDCQILFRTFLTLLQVNAVSHPGSATMPEFLGQDNIMHPDSFDRTSPPCS